MTMTCLIRFIHVCKDAITEVCMYIICDMILHHSNVHRLFLGTRSVILSPCIIKTKRAEA